MFKSKTISISIYRSYEEVYDFLADPLNSVPISCRRGSTSG